ncbi:MAG: peptide chain release factor 2 [Candidatus Eisenbacteria bacterium]|nr:peptide chain release factor 2 [Candidatus Eisenbacteria bacterium]
MERQEEVILRAEARMGEAGFWDRPDDAEAVISELKSAKRKVETWGGLNRRLSDSRELLEMAAGEEDAATLEELDRDAEALARAIADLELVSLLSDPNDRLGALVSIHPGAGGTDSQDWAQMLFRMYTRWLERRGYPHQVLDLQSGDEAGIKDATLEVTAEYGYGYLKSESGVHRLVRLSPFDAAHRRHTAFASVFVFPRVDDTIKVEIDMGDVRVDTYRSSGAGGQHVNKTDSAVRMTHLPTNIVATSQNERSQHRNRENALTILKARLYAHLLEQERKKLAHITDNKSDIAFGSQIRSYVLHPYTMVKDHRTDHETSNVQSVLDGDLDGFIDAYLRRRE